MRASYTINISKSDEELVSGLKELIDNTKEISEHTIGELSTKLTKEKASDEEDGLRLDKRKQVLDRYQEILDKKKLQYERALNNRDSANQKFMSRTSKNTESRRRSKTLQNTISQMERNIKRVEEVYLDGELEKRALTLRFLENQINTDVPVKYTHESESKQVLTWQTDDVYIRDGFGGWLDFNFGKFDVKVTHETTSSIEGRILVLCSQVGTESEKEDRRRSDGNFAHPHINYTDDACLGARLSRDTLVRMSTRDIAQVIEGVSEFLSHYNREDAYNRLSGWCANRWDSGVCESGEHLRDDCPCPRCNYCCALFEPEDLSECGSCPSCCMISHINISPDNLVRKNYQNTGINGTNCYIR